MLIQSLLSSYNLPCSGDVWFQYLCMSIWKFALGHRSSDHVTPKKNSLVASECHMGRSCPVIICYLHPSTPNFIHPNFSGPSRRLWTSLALGRSMESRVTFCCAALSSKGAVRDRLESQKKRFLLVPIWTVGGWATYDIWMENPWKSHQIPMNSKSYIAHDLKNTKPQRQRLPRSVTLSWFWGEPNESKL